MVHEYSIVQALVDRVEAEAHARQAIAVERVVVSIGELSGVEVELLRTAYETYRTRTICERAPLDVTFVPAEWVCRPCAAPVGAAGIRRCPACGGPATLQRGDEILLERIDMEVQ